jgi:hypothetical protein
MFPGQSRVYQILIDFRPPENQPVEGRIREHGLDPTVGSLTTLPESAEFAVMKTLKQEILAQPQGEQPMVEGRSAIVDTLAGRVRIESDETKETQPLRVCPCFLQLYPAVSWAPLRAGKTTPS